MSCKKTWWLAAAAILLCCPPAEAALRHQYTFNDGTGAGLVPDQVGSADATFVDPTGLGQIAGGMADLTNNNGRNSNQDWLGGTAEGIFIDLPNFTFTDAAFFGNSGEATIETWVTIQENRNWARLWDFGNSDAGEDISTGGPGSDYVIGVPQTGLEDIPFAASTHSQMGGENFLIPEPPAPLPTGMEHHVVFALDKNDTAGGANPNGSATLYLNGEQVAAGAIHNGEDGAGAIDITNFNELNSWLGRAQWPDPLFDGWYNEVRIYDHELSQSEVQANFAAGPEQVDLPLVVIDRDTGTISLANPTSSDLQLVSYSLTSAAGALDTDGWQSIDAGNVFDPDGTWANTALTTEEISESGTGDGGTLVAGADPAASLGAAWFRSPVEDVQAIVELSDGTRTGALVSYIGNNDQPFSPLDLNVDGQVDETDWFLFADAAYTDLSGLPALEAGRAGDLDGDGDNDFDDFRLFKEQFNAMAGAGALEAIIAANQVPEPGTVGLLALASAAAAGRWRARSRRA